MDPLKMGRLIKALRKEKNLTQEQLAEAFFVSGKTVSRWETGSTLPDLLTLQNIADYFGVDIRELIDGERFPAERKDDALPEEKETVKKMSEYSDSKEKRSIRKMWWVFLLILLAIAAAATFLVLKKRNEDLDRVQSRTVIGEATHYEPDGDGGLEIFLLCNETSISRIRVTPETRVPEGLLTRLQAGEKGLLLHAETVYTERELRNALKNGTAALYRATDLYSAGTQPGYISSEDRALRPLLSLREGYTVLQAERDGCVVADGYALLHGEMLLEEFLLRCGQGIPGTIRVYQRYSTSGNSPDYFL
ncbi:MAG: helix-turn-helix transcriptional regulator, partial [Lachnospiraceae bacterium]|nr:helix-turn-helix transcriptional regulator [Lachnospiraceae bacterium]